MPDYLRGCVAVAACDPDPIACRRVFSVDFQYWLDRVVDQKFLRKQGDNLRPNYEWTPSSCIYYGSMPPRIHATAEDILGAPTRGPRRRRTQIKPAPPYRMFLAIEVSVHGAVAVYFEEPVTDGTLAEVLHYWVRGSWMTALNVAHLLGLRGEAAGSTLLAYSNIPRSPLMIEPDLDGPRHPRLSVYRDPCLPIYHQDVELVPDRFRNSRFPYDWLEDAATQQTAIARDELRNLASYLAEDLNPSEVQECWDRVHFR